MCKMFPHWLINDSGKMNSVVTPKVDACFCWCFSTFKKHCIILVCGLAVTYLPDENYWWIVLISRRSVVLFGKVQDLQKFIFCNFLIFKFTQIKKEMNNIILGKQYLFSKEIKAFLQNRIFLMHFYCRLCEVNRAFVCSICSMWSMRKLL